MTSSVSSLFNKSILFAVFWIAAACLCLQLAAASADENTTAVAAVPAVTDQPHIEHHGVADGTAAVNGTSEQVPAASPAATTRVSPPAAGTGTSIAVTSSTACLLTAVCVAIARLF